MLHIPFGVNGSFSSNPIQRRIARMSPCARLEQPFRTAFQELGPHHITLFVIHDGADNSLDNPVKR